MHIGRTIPPKPVGPSEWLFMLYYYSTSFTDGNRCYYYVRSLLSLPPLIRPRPNSHSCISGSGHSVYLLADSVAAVG